MAPAGFPESHWWLLELPYRICFRRTEWHIYPTLGVTHAYLSLLSCPSQETLGHDNCSSPTLLIVQGTHSGVCVCIPLQCCYRRLEKLFLSPDARLLDFQYSHFSYRVCLVNVEINEPPCQREAVLYLYRSNKTKRSSIYNLRLLKL